MNKTEHAGAKNGGGWRGRRVEAKAWSRVHRRLDDKELVKSGMQECPDCPDPEVHRVELVFERELRANNCYVPRHVLRLLADIAYHSLGVRLPIADSKPEL